MLLGVCISCKQNTIYVCVTGGVRLRCLDLPQSLRELPGDSFLRAPRERFFRFSAYLCNGEYVAVGLRQAHSRHIRQRMIARIKLIIKEIISLKYSLVVIFGCNDAGGWLPQ